MREREVSTEPSALPQPCNLSNPTLIPFFSIACDTGASLESRFRAASSGFSDTQEGSIVPELVDTVPAMTIRQRDEGDVESTSATPALASMILGVR